MLGKLLPPRLGLMTYVVDSFRRGKSDDVVLLPVSIAYDQITDVGEGRYPDGSARAMQMALPTPGASNQVFRVAKWQKTGDSVLLQWTTRPGQRKEGCRSRSST